MESGKVKWFDDNKGYGFIEQDVGDDLFVHYSDIQQEGYKTLREGQEVEFEIEETEKGLAAKEVNVVGDGEAAEDEFADSSFDEEEFDQQFDEEFEDDFDDEFEDDFGTSDFEDEEESFGGSDF